MKRFSTLKPKSLVEPDKDDVIWSNDHIKVVNFEDWSVIKEPDFVVCIIHLVEEDVFLLRHEYIPTFKYVDGQEYHITVISGTMKVGESPEKALKREIEEEAGIVIKSDFKIEFMKPLYLNKGNASKYHPALIQLTSRDYHEVKARGDGSKVEKMSQTIKLDMKYKDAVNTSDLITDYMMCKFKESLENK